MAIQDVLRAIDEEVVKLERVKHLIAGDPLPESPVRRRGRPKGSANKTATLSAPVAKKTAKRVMSTEGKARIAAAQKARWAAQKRAAASPKRAAKKSTAPPAGGTPKPAAKKTPAKKAIAKKAPAKKIVPAKKTAPPISAPESSAPPAKTAGA